MDSRLDLFARRFGVVLDFDRSSPSGGGTPALLMIGAVAGGALAPAVGHPTLGACVLAVDAMAALLLSCAPSLRFVETAVDRRSVQGGLLGDR
ncbi:MAG TPA: hypothetical protein VGH40_24135 [Roseiarcus sp.]|jgi:hypothetical protein